MAKAPAFQFYYDRFNSSTSLWDDAQVGKYVRLMICQANKGYVTEKELHKVAGGDEDVLSKFTEISGGKFANEVLSEVISARDAYSANRANNRKSGVSKKNKQTHDNHMKNICLSQKEHMVDVDVVVDKVEVVKKEKRVQGEKQNFAPEIITYLNELNGTNFRIDTKATCRLIDQRIGEGYSVQELKEIVEYKIAEWKGTEWEKFLQPDTLFNGEKCAKYRNQVQAAKDKGLTAVQIKGNGGGKTKPTMEGILDIIYNKQQKQ